MANKGVKPGVQPTRVKADRAALKVLEALQDVGYLADLQDNLAPWLEVAGKRRPEPIAQLAEAAREADVAVAKLRKALTKYLERSAAMTPAELIVATGDDPRQEKLPGIDGAQS